MPDKSAREIFQKNLGLAKKISNTKAAAKEIGSSEKEFKLYPTEMMATLEKDIKLLGERISAPDSVERELMISAAELKKSIDELKNIFGIVSEEVKKEDPNLTLKSINKKLDLVSDQNRKIAQAILVISDKLNYPVPSKEPLMPRVPPAPKATAVSAPIPPSASLPGNPPPPPYNDKKKFISNAFG